MVLVTGAKGQLGCDIINELNIRSISNKGIDINDVDLTNKIKVSEYIKKEEPKYVIHCAGYTQVDKADSNEEEMKKCLDVNFEATKNIAELCKEMNITLLYISTDYVFDGKKLGEYEVYDKANPLSNYGKSKAYAELAIEKLLQKYFIIRTSWLFGENGENFINTIGKLSENRDFINVVDDQVGSPTYTLDLSKAICDIILTSKYGIYHITNEGFCSRAELAEKVIKVKNTKCIINHVTSDQYKTIAIRPLNSKLSKKKLDENGFKRLPSWQEAVERYLKVK